MSTLLLNNVQIGISGTASQNFVMAVPAVPDGTMKLSRGNQGATTSDILSIDSNNNVGLGMSPVANNGALQLGNFSSIKAIIEAATITAAAPAATTNFDVITQAIHYYTTNASANFTLNIRGDGTTSLNTIMQTGQSATVALLVTNGATPYRPTTFQVDGTGVTPKWQGGTAPTAGNANSIDIYQFTIIKTAAATFTMLASQTRFA